jgi:hypothetical protein
MARCSRSAFLSETFFKDVLRFFSCLCVVNTAAIKIHNESKIEGIFWFARKLLASTRPKNSNNAPAMRAILES